MDGNLSMNSHFENMSEKDSNEMADHYMIAQRNKKQQFRVIDKSGKVFEVHKYIKDAEGVEHIWCNEWYGHHGIGHDCEWVDKFPSQTEDQMIQSIQRHTE